MSFLCYCVQTCRTHRHQQVAAFRQKQPGQVRWVITGSWWTTKHGVKSFSNMWVTGDTVVNVSSEVWGLSDTFKLMWQVIWINTDLQCSMCLYSVQTQPVLWSGPPEGSTVTWFTSFTSRLIYQVDPCDQLMSAFIYNSYVSSKYFCFTSLKVYCRPVEHPASVTPLCYCYL